MGLNEYRQKRDFRLSKEPPGRPERHDGRLQFVVQRHDASHLHFDFRIENQGVLKSWAVPKGISMDPANKRLAIQVEDHPFDYKNFEGQIPKGNYGAGTVKIWDQGTYFPGNCSGSPEKCVSQNLNKGHLELILKGKKLKGAFTLVRMQKTENQWLLMKKKDEFSQSAAGKENIETVDFKGAPESTIPIQVKPMLATPVDKPFDGKDWVFEVKWDGYRCLAQINDGKVRLYSRNNIDQNNRFGAIVKELVNLPFDALFDGEIVALDKKGRSDFQMLQNYLRTSQGNIFYYIFDILYAGKSDLRSLPLNERRKILEKILPKFKNIRLSGYIEDKGAAFYRAAGAKGLEGIIAKNINSKYLSGIRSKDWLKVKIVKRQEVLIGGFTEPRGARRYFGSLIIGFYEGKKLVYAGHVGGGFDDQALKYLYGKLLPLARKISPFPEIPKTNMPVTWVEPKLLCEVKFTEWTQGHIMRHPVFLGLREDKQPLEVIKEVPENTQKVKRQAGQPTAVLTKAELTNQEKLYWPREGLTKKDVIKYYDSISSWILPFLKDRPQSLYRSPNGISQPGFFQKNYRQKLPEWVETVKITSEKDGKEIQYLLCQNKDTLLFIANLGCIEINVWNSSVKNLDHPDYIVLDYDPVDIAFKKVVSVVVSAKDILDKLGLPGFCKTSGGRGLHIYIPVKAIYTHDQIKDFARLINMATAKKHPDITSLERNPSKRKGLVYLDYLQNRKGSTMAAPYSLRPRPGATVSTPLNWKELTPKLDPFQFNLRNMVQRVKERPDPWKDFFKEKADIVKSIAKLGKLFQ